ncbi:MAG: 50S ribosomal protein L6 [Gammaproteobacteria bacterium]|nr:50S ribosomal protein L6 [Gammaproteobacteria bacterium]MCY4210117.1 50S ribosomal protein L6 [Gammaproteobacteria bacterium]MCY4282474.1 50S ribosomal protein L6 [Gammaproteobacteria bacterium]MCY4338381.1 50S ribosomal protein L6 [Gammaproteobacteria bacterium]
MSRIANNPVTVPGGVEVDVRGAQVRVKGGKGALTHQLHALVSMDQDGELLRFSARNNSKSARALAGTTRAILQNMVTGVSEGFEITLEIVGVGYRAQATPAGIELALGFSHPVQLAVPDGVTVETPSQTQIIVRGADKQQVGQVAADIRNYRPPEPYKGKGVRYADEQVLRKEAKKA